jgi:hypothetical protein
VLPKKWTTCSGFGGRFAPDYCIKTTGLVYSILLEDDVKERITGFGEAEKSKTNNLEDDKLKKFGNS